MWKDTIRLDGKFMWKDGTNGLKDPQRLVQEVDDRSY